MKLSMRDIGLMVIVATLSACAAKRPAPIFDARAPDAYRTAPPDMNPLTGDIPLHVYDKGGMEW